MKLSQIELTDAQAEEFVSFLEERVMRRIIKAMDDSERREHEALTTARWNRVRELAQETARQHIKLVGISAEAQAEAAYDAWIAHEGWNDPYDVDDRFDPHSSDSDWREAWVFAYVEALPKGTQE